MSTKKTILILAVLASAVTGPALAADPQLPSTAHDAHRHFGIDFTADPQHLVPLGDERETATQTLL